MDLVLVGLCMYSSTGTSRVYKFNRMVIEIEEVNAEYWNGKLQS